MPSATEYVITSAGLVLCLKMMMSDTTKPTMNAGRASTYRPLHAVRPPATMAAPTVIAVLVTMSSTVIGR